MVDLNWFYSTMAQSSAALVAIIGALIVSKAINLYTERKLLQKEMTELELEIKSLKNSNDIKLKNKILQEKKNNYEARTIMGSFKYGFPILAYLSIFNILAPLYFIPIENSSTDMIIRPILFWLFVIGIIALLLFIFNEISEATKDRNLRYYLKKLLHIKS